MSAPFSRRMLIALFGLGGASLAAAFVFAIFADELGGGPDTVGPSTYSRSALGHAAFADVLRRVGVPVVVSRHNSGVKAGDSSLLVVLEPDTGDGFQLPLEQMLGDARAALVVLPKLRGVADPDKQSWVRYVGGRDRDDARDVATIATGGSVSIVGGSGADLGNTRGYPAPTLPAPQLVSSERLVPIIHSDEGILLGEVTLTHDDGEQTLVWVLSDPDVLSNHGLGRGDNAELAVRIVHDLAGGAGVVIDETMHGYEKPPSIFRQMFDFPLVLATLQALLTIAVLLWAATGRFGSPRPRAPDIAPGKAFLIDNTASLLHFGGHGHHMLTRYLQTSIVDVKRGLHLPAPLWHDPLIERLDRIGKTKGVTTALTELIDQVTREGRSRRTNERQVLFIANRVYRWRQEMLYGH